VHRVRPRRPLPTVADEYVRLVRAEGWTAERFRSEAKTLRNRCDGRDHLIGWGRDVAMHDLAARYEREAESMERAS
jgi:hypothetical protein